MKIVIIHDGPKEHALALTSVVNELHREYPASHIRVITDDENRVFYQHAQDVSVGCFHHAPSEVVCDLLVDYGGSNRAVDHALAYSPKEYRGLLPVPGKKSDINAFQGLYTDTEVRRNIFQLLYGVAGLKWKGQGYAFRYYPRTRQGRGRVGVALRDKGVRGYIRENLDVPDARLWHVPVRRNVLKQFDEVNLVESLVTDDPFVMHVGVCLRKRVEYLIYEPPLIRPEFFRNGCVHLVPDEIRKGTDGVA